MNNTPIRYHLPLSHLAAVPFFSASRTQYRHLVIAVLLFIFGALSQITYAAPEEDEAPTFKSDAPDIYIVKKGDTLWDISGRFLKSPWRWPDVWAVNKQIKNPHWIYPGDRILLCHVFNKTLVVRDDGNGCATIAEDGTVKLSPRIRTSELDSAIPAIPLGEIKGWLLDSVILDDAKLNALPYVVAARDNRIINAAGDTVYVRGSKLTLGETYGIYRRGDPLFDPQTGKPLGIETRLVGRGKILGKERNIYTVRVTSSLMNEIRDGDRIMQEPESDLPKIFYPTDGVSLDNATIIRVLESVGNATQGNVIIMNRGSKAGVQSGQVYAVSRRGPTVFDPRQGDSIKLPSERSGLIMVYRVFDNVSYALVMESENILKVGDVISTAYGE